MKSIYIEATPDTPEITLDKDKNIFEIVGNSLPENVEEFYEPIQKWMDEYMDNPNKESKVLIQLSYSNSSSSEQIFRILEKFETLAKKGIKITVEWIYETDDDDILESGQNYAETLELPFEIHSV